MRKEKIPIEGMHCASCAGNIEKALKKEGGVKEVKVNFGSEKAYVEYDEDQTSLGNIRRIIEDTGYEVGEDDLGHSHAKKVEAEERRKQRNNFVLAFLLALPVAAWSYLDLPFLTPKHADLWMLALTTVVVFWAGRQFFLKAWQGLRNYQANMDTLVALGVSAAYFYSVASTFLFTEQPLFYETAAALTAFILFGRYLEVITKTRTSSAIKKLMELQTGTATVERKGRQKKIPIEEIREGDIVIVKPGQKVPVDGTITDGHSSLDESIITGESIPQYKEEGDKVIGGTMNRSGSFKFEAEQVGKDTVLQNIIDMIEEAQASQPPIQNLADKVAGYFVPAVIVLALLAFGVWYYFGPGFIFALTVGISVVVIACPCAMGLATPTAVMVGTGAGAENGILVRNGEALEVMGKIDSVILDKTGTLTEGKPEVMNLVVSKRYDPKVTLKYAAIAEKRSEHPLAEAVLEEAESMGLKVPDPEDFQAVEGKGVIAKTKTKEIKVGSKDFMRSEHIRLGDLEGKVAGFENEGKTVLVVAVDGEAAGVIAVADKLKASSRKAIKMLHRLGLEIIMMTGDNERVARAVAEDLGIDDFFAEVRPEDKTAKVKKLQRDGKKVAMVGDGVNDAPALAQAEVGIAIGAGTDIAIESADIILVNSDPADIYKSIRLSRDTLRKIKQNLFWAFAYNTAAIPIAAGVFYPFFGLLLKPEIAGFAMAMSSVTVVVNSLSLRRTLPFKFKKKVQIKL